ncbi:MAG: hypothetical protein KI792_02640 [Alphaproteobacteria bacterium]|nr:hypothetical protein [Alphaproteobacteria bacterium SS10]
MLISPGKTPIIVGEEEDLKGISLLVIGEDGKSIWMEQADTTRKNLGILADEVITGLNDGFDEMVVAALDGDDLAWSYAVDFGTFRNPPRALLEETIQRLMDEMADQDVTFAVSQPAEDERARKKRERTRR